MGIWEIMCVIGACLTKKPVLFFGIWLSGYLLVLIGILLIVFA